MHRCLPLTFAVLALGVPALMSGCQAGSGGIGSMRSISGLVGDWMLTQINGQDVSAMLPAGMKAPNFSLKDDGTFAGFGGVNRLASKVDLTELAKGKFKLGPTAATKMAGPAEAMKVEDLYTDALGKVDGFKLRDGGLDLTQAGKSLLSFVRGG